MTQLADPPARPDETLTAAVDDVTLGAQSLTMVQALNRALAHYAQHIGQIVFLAKHLRASRWQTLSIPRGKSEDYKTASPKTHSRGMYKT